MTKQIFTLLLLVSISVYRVITIPKPIYQNNDHVRLITKVTKEPVRYESSQYLRLHNLKIYLDLYPQIYYGDQVIIEGQVKGDTLNNPKLIKIIKPINPLYYIRLKIIDFYTNTLPSPHDALVAGIVLGSKQSISENFWQSLKSSGTLHVVVASGMNVVLVGGFILNALIIYINRKKALIISLIAIWIYALLAGFDAPIIRAAFMGSIAFTAQSLGRLYHARRALILAAITMVIITPAWIYDLGFILSFVSTLSLMLFNRLIDNKLYFVPRIIRQDLSTSLSAQIGVAPILYFAFGNFNPLSPFINTLILWTIPPITIIGGAAGILSLILNTPAQLLLYTAYPLSKIFIIVITLFT